jgi:rubrerythrin
MEDLSKQTVEELLGVAIRSEIDSNRIYKAWGDRLSNPLLKEKFQWLAKEEQKHKEILEHLYKELQPDAELHIPDQVPEELMVRITIIPSSTFADFLYQAMETEKSAETFYAKLAGRVEDTKKRILNYLSSVEHSHYMMLKSEYTVALVFEDYAEKEIDKVTT